MFPQGAPAPCGTPTLHQFTKTQAMITITRDSAAYGIVTIRLEGKDTDICVHGSISEKEMAEIISDALVKAEPRSKTWGITEITAAAAIVAKSTGLQGDPPLVTIGSDGVTIRHDYGKKRYLIRSEDWGVSWVSQYYHDGELIWSSHGETLEESLDPT